MSPKRWVAKIYVSPAAVFGAGGGVPATAF